jgi:hypothetical protein
MELLEKLPIVQLLKNSPTFCRTRRFITVFTRSLHLSLSWARSIQSIPQLHLNIIQKINLRPRPFAKFCNNFLRWRVVSSTPNPQAGWSPLVGCPELLIQYIRSYPPYLEAVSSIRNLRTRHAVVTRAHLTWEGTNKYGKCKIRWRDNIKTNPNAIPVWGFG